MAQEVRRNEALSRYELLVDGDVVGIADYRESPDRVVLPHTVVNPSMRGRGLAEVLVRGALDDLRGGGRTVVPSCWYVAEFIEGHPEYQDMLAA